MLGVVQQVTVRVFVSTVAKPLVTAAAKPYCPPLFAMLTASFSGGLAWKVSNGDSFWWGNSCMQGSATTLTCTIVTYELFS